LWAFGVLPTGGVHLDHEKEGGHTATDLGAPTFDAPISATASLAKISEELVRTALAAHPHERIISLLGISASHLERHWDVQLGSTSIQNKRKIQPSPHPCIMFETILAIITMDAYIASFPLELSSSGTDCRSDRHSDRCCNHMDVQRRQLVEGFRRAVP
jgi:hypothetical protein